MGWPVPGSPGVLALAIDPSGRIELATVAGGQVRIRRQRIPNADWENWIPLSMPSSVTSFDGHLVSFGKNADGRLELLAQDQGQVLWHTWQAKSVNGNAPSWTNSWASFW